MTHTHRHRMMLARCLRSPAPRGLFRVAGFSSSVQQNTQHTHTRHLTTTAENSTTHAELQTDTARGFDVGLLVSALRQENASDICVIRVSPELRYTDHMIIVSGSSPRHLSAMAENVLKAYKILRQNEERHVRLEGRDCDDWKCIDFGSMVLHLMLSDTRDTYELEKLWTLRSHDEQLQRTPEHTLPADFILDMKS